MHDDFADDEFVTPLQPLPPPQPRRKPDKPASKQDIYGWGEAEEADAKPRQESAVAARVMARALAAVSSTCVMYTLLVLRDGAALAAG